MITSNTAPSLKEIQQARNRISSYITHTPLLEAPLLSSHSNHERLLVKAEVLQKTGSFKIRGAINKIRFLVETGFQETVVAYSSGNHAQAVAAAASLFGLKSIIVMPEDAPRIKVQRTIDLGATVRFYNRYRESREALAQEIVAEVNGIIVPPFDDFDVIAGQGTVGLEIIEQCQSVYGINPDVILIPCSGGGLCAGVSTAVKALSPDTRIYAVEPEGFDDTKRSLESGSIVALDNTSPSICDALLLRQPGRLTFPINRSHLTGGLTVSDYKVKEAMTYAFQQLKLVTEPGGAVALAAGLSNPMDFTDKTVVVILSGGNVDSALFADTIQ